MSITSKSSKIYSNFDPLYMPNCILWLDGNDVSSNSITMVNYPSNTTITSWKDKSGNSNDATPTNQPYLSNIPNDNSYVYLDSGTSSYFSGNLSITGNSFTSFVVAKLTTVPTTSERRLLGFANVASSLQDDNSASTCVPVFVDTFPAGNILQTKRNSPGTNFSSRTISSGTKFMVSTVYNGTVGELYTNGSPPGTTGTSSGNFNIANYSVGAKIISVGNYWIGQIGEVIVYNRALSTTERQQVEGYLGKKWGLGSSLVAGHPYISRNPVLSRYNPTDIGGCYLWIDASDKSSFQLSGGSTVFSVDDKSPNTAIVVNVVGTLTWTYNGLDGLRPAFGTTSGALVAELSASLTDFTNTTFIVSSYTSAPNNGNAAVAFATSPTGSATFYRALDYTTSSPTRFRTIAFFSSVYQTTTALGPAANNTPFLFSSSFTGSTPINNYYNAGTTSGSVAAASPSVGATHCMVGCDGFTFTNPSTPAQYWTNGQIAEVLLFNRVLTDTERYNIDSYLCYKWGIQSNMPANHPYKNYYPMKVN